MIPVVVDAGPLIHLSQADALYLLDEFDTVTVPKTVIKELADDDVRADAEDLTHRPLARSATR